MKKQLWVLLIVILFVSGMNVALAQNSNSLSFSVPFPFEVGENTLPAGEYRITFDGRDSRHLQLVNTKTSQKQFITFVTRLSQRSEGSIVFDSVNEARYLSEVYLAGNDGFQIRATPEEHGHVKGDTKITD